MTYYYYYYYYYFFQLRTAAIKAYCAIWVRRSNFFATRCLHACHQAKAPSGGIWNCGQEMFGNFA
jgi:hypothetical protein